MIIAIREKDRALVACTITDRTDDLTNADYLDPENLPLRFLSNGMLLAFDRLNRASDVVLYNEEITSILQSDAEFLKKLKKDDPKTDFEKALIKDSRFISWFKLRTPDAIIKGVIPRMQKAFKESNYSLRKDGCWRNVIIYADKERIFEIDPFFAFSEISDFTCWGYKIEPIRSVLDITKGQPAEERILRAIEYWGTLHKKVPYPFVIADTGMQEIKYYHEGGRIE